MAVPYIFACGSCAQCARGALQVCERQDQAGFTHDGSFAEYVVADRADFNLSPLPEAIDFDTAAVLGCRFATAYRAVREVAAVAQGETVAVFGCGGVGLSAVMIAAAAGASVVAVDVNAEALALAGQVGAVRTVDASAGDPVAEIGSVDVALDALGSAATARASVLCLRRHGRQVQIGLLAGADADPPMPMSRVISYELTLHGSHGLSAHAYPAMLAEIESGALRPQELITRRIGLDEVPAAVAALSTSTPPGVTVINP